jgi:hypothetical protein
MMQQTIGEHGAERPYQDIVARDEIHRPFLKQVATSAGGLLALLGIGLVVLIVVVWKAPSPDPRGSTSPPKGEVKKGCRPSLDPISVLGGLVAQVLGDVFGG